MCVLVKGLWCHHLKALASLLGGIKRRRLRSGGRQCMAGCCGAQPAPTVAQTQPCWASGAAVYSCAPAAHHHRSADPLHLQEYQDADPG